MKHVVDKPREPFESRTGLLEVHQVPAWEDNLIWVGVCKRSGTTFAVDGPDAGGTLEYCEARGLSLTTILNTHTHGDHIGINQDLERRGLLQSMRVIGSRQRADDVPGLTEGVGEGDTVRVGELDVQVMLTEGHIDGHVSYLIDGVLFCGDTLFAGGCGYLFDGPPTKMFDSLSRLRALDEDTHVCCAHEYTQDNMRFAWSVDADNAALAERIRDVWAVRGKGGCTVPSSIGLERATNPFMRFDAPALRQRVAAAWPDRTLDTDADVFAATRALKDRKDYRERSDGDLPL